MGEVARRAGGGKKVAGRGSRVASRESSRPPPGYAVLPPTSLADARSRGETLKGTRCKVLPRERSDLGGGGPQGRRGKERPESRVTSRESSNPSPGGTVGGCREVIPLQDGVPQDGRGRCEASGDTRLAIGSRLPATGCQPSAIGHQPSARRSQVASPKSRVAGPPSGYAVHCKVLPRERSDLGGGGPQGRRGQDSPESRVASRGS